MEMCIVLIENTKEGIMIIVIMVLVAVWLIICVLTASEFDSIAEKKGYSGYFKWCFWLGMIGWLMVIALPDKKSTEEIKRTIQNYENKEIRSKQGVSVLNNKNDERLPPL